MKPPAAPARAARPPQPPKPSLTLRLMMSILVLGVLSWLAFYVINGWNDTLLTTIAYSYTVDEGVEARGVVVRQEQLLPGTQGSDCDLIPAEGERVGQGQTVAILYQDSTGAAARKRIRILEAEIHQLQYALSSGSAGTDLSRLDGDVLASITRLRAISAGRDLSTLEDAALELRTRVFKREDTFAAHGEADSVAALITARQEELLRLQAGLSRASRFVSTPQSGTFSGVVDGLEDVLTPELLSSLTADGLARLLAQPVGPPPDAVGRLITSSTWYFAAVLPARQAADLVEGRPYALSFSHDYFGRVEMELLRLSLPQEGDALAVFAGRSNLSDITALRRQTVDIVKRQVEGIRIPRRALRVQTVELPVAQADGSEQMEQVPRTGVYTVVGRRAEWQPVEVLYTGDNFYLVVPSDPNDPSRLRAGDTLILSSDVFDGKVVR